MACNKNLISRCVKLAANLSPKINFASYISKLTETSEHNYSVFSSFACACSDTMLAILYKLRHFDGDEKLLNIAGEIISARRALREDEKYEEEEDVGGHVTNLHQNYSRIQSAGNNNSARTAMVRPSRRRRAEEEPEAGPSRRPRLLEENPAIPVVVLDDDDGEENMDDDDADIAYVVSSPDSEVFSPEFLREMEERERVEINEEETEESREAEEEEEEEVQEEEEAIVVEEEETEREEEEGDEEEEENVYAPSREETRRWGISYSPEY